MSPTAAPPAAEEREASLRSLQTVENKQDENRGLQGAARSTYIGIMARILSRRRPGQYKASVRAAWSWPSFSKSIHPDLAGVVLPATPKCQGAVIHDAEPRWCLVGPPRRPCATEPWPCFPSSNGSEYPRVHVYTSRSYTENIVVSSVYSRQQFPNDNALAPRLGARSHNPTRLEALGILGKSDRLPIVSKL